MHRFTVALLSFCSMVCFAQPALLPEDECYVRAVECLRSRILPEGAPEPDVVAFFREEVRTVRDEIGARLSSLDVVHAGSDRSAVAAEREALGRMLSVRGDLDRPAAEVWCLRFREGGRERVSRFRFDTDGVLYACCCDELEATDAQERVRVLPWTVIEPGHPFACIPEVEDVAGDVVSSVADAPSVPDIPRREEITPLSDDVQRHALFKGVAIDGAPEALVLRLIREGGFVAAEDDGDVKVLSGTFSGVRDSRVEVHSVDGVVWKVSVKFPDRAYWMQVQESYSQFKESFQDKYGREYDSREHLSSRYPEGSGREVWGFQDGTSVWESSFAIPMGYLKVFVSFVPASQGFALRIDYIDKVNYAFKLLSDVEDL